MAARSAPLAANTGPGQGLSGMTMPAPCMSQCTHTGAQRATPGRASTPAPGPRDHACSPARAGWLHVRVRCQCRPEADHLVQRLHSGCAGRDALPHKAVQRPAASLGRQRLGVQLIGRSRLSQHPCLLINMHSHVRCWHGCPVKHEQMAAKHGMRQWSHTAAGLHHAYEMPKSLPGASIKSLIVPDHLHDGWPHSCRRRLWYKLYRTIAGTHSP